MITVITLPNKIRSNIKAYIGEHGFIETHIIYYFKDGREIPAGLRKYLKLYSSFSVIHNVESWSSRDILKANQIVLERRI